MMHIPNRLKRFWPLTIKTYAFGFIIFMSLIFGLLGWGMQYKLNIIRDEAYARNQAKGLEEIHYVFRHIVGELEHNAKYIASQGETLRQLANPAHYINQGDSHIHGKGKFPAYLRAVELYTPDGNAMAGHPAADLPRPLSGQDSGNYATRRDNRDFLYVFYPISATDKSVPVLQGHLGFKLDILDALKYDQHYSLVDIDTLTLNIREAEIVPLEQILSRIDFSLIPNTESAALAASIDRFQRQLLFSMIVLYLLLYLLLSTVLSAPLRRLSQHIDTLRKGQGGLLAQNYTRSLPVAELEKVRISLNDYQNKLEEMHFSLNEKNDELWQLAHHDPLTGIYNRRGFEEDWGHVLSVSSGHRLGVALLLFDCDHFKAINDTYGHPTGDQVIKAIAHTLQTTLRHGDRLYRLGGDEFATLFIDIDRDLALQTAERCIEAVSKFDFSAMGIKEPVRLSAGMAYASGTDTEILHNLPKQADIAMYHAKRPGKKKIALFEQSMFSSTNILYSNSINNLVFKALEDDESIEMHYQPITNLNTGKVNYYEALVRIRNGVSLIMPSTIFPLIEERRLEAEFDLVILGQIARDIELGKIPAGSGVSFNVSGMGVMDKAVQEKIHSLAAYIPRYKLIIEVTETALITQLQLASSILNTLRQKGFLIALDDFGSGYSSLSYLSSMPVDCIKFDISLTRQLLEGSRQSIIIGSLATMALKAGYILIAEGVETEEMLNKINDIGFNYGQGFLLGQPENTCHETAGAPYFNNKK